jgi:hypothetical protein
LQEETERILDYPREATDQRRKIQQKFYQEKGAPKFAKFKWVGLSKGKEERRFSTFTQVKYFLGYLS